VDKDVEHILTENANRTIKINEPYDPIIGVGCYGDRVPLTITDAPYPLIYIPRQMLNNPIIRQVAKHKSIEKLYRANKVPFDREELQKCWIDICEIRISYDPEYYFRMYETIEDALTGELIPFVMNRAQRKFHAIVMADIENEKPVRIITLKARQHGISTYIQMLFSWIQKVKKKRWNSVVCAHVNDAAKNIRSMYTRSMETMMPIGGVRYEISNFDQTLNIKEIKERGCRITVGSAEKPDSVRSQNPKLAHFSEVAFYPDTDMKKTSALLSSIIGTMKLVPWTAVFYESTANGLGDYFETEYSRAKRGESAYTPIFLPWFYNPNYSEPITTDYYGFNGKKKKGDIRKFVSSLSEYELSLFENNEEVTLEKINWYRAKAGEMSSISEMRQEFPSDDIEAFQDSGKPVFRSEDIEALRSDCRPPMAIGTLVADEMPQIANIEPSKRKGIMSNIHFVNDPEAMEAYGSSDVKLRLRKTQNKLMVWRHPSSLNVRHRYVVIFDPQKGISDKADWGVITVIDRLPLIDGEKPEIVAQFRGHIDKDISIWIAAQVAKFYNDALLVVESNTYDSDVKDDDAELIFETIKAHYANLYTRTSADKVREGYPIKWGFNTNRSTKPMIISNFISVIREGGYVERDEEALNEARMYEQKENGSYGAKEGHHDDILMTRMIGMYVAYAMPMPVIVEENAEPTVNRKVAAGMSDI
jgi:hypothetical protein